jgi:hypothetical protein
MDGAHQSSSNIGPPEGDVPPQMRNDPRVQETNKTENAHEAPENTRDTPCSRCKVLAVKLTDLETRHHKDSALLEEVKAREKSLQAEIEKLIKENEDHAANMKAAEVALNDASKQYRSLKALADRSVNLWEEAQHEHDDSMQDAAKSRGDLADSEVQTLETAESLKALHVKRPVFVSS